MNYDYRNEFTHNIHNENHTLTNDVKMRLTSNEKVYRDKTTYCRPVLNYYNEQFIYKTMERNARLKRLVKNLAIARRREKETVSWNNFINELKTKHAVKDDDAKNTLAVTEPEEYITPEICNDYYNTRFSCVQSRPCKHLLQEFYGTYDESQSRSSYHPYRPFDENSVRQSHVNRYLPHDRDSYCYPTSSQGRLIMMDRERLTKESINYWPRRLSDKYIPLKSRRFYKRRDKAVDTEEYTDVPNYQRIFLHSRATSFDEMISIQADVRFYPDITKHYHDKAVYTTEQSPSFVKDNNETDINSEQGTSNYLKKLSLMNIDTKLETLIKSINKFIDEIKINKQKRKKNDDYKNILYKYTKYRKDTKGEIKLIESNTFSKHKKTDKFDSATDISQHKFNWSKQIIEDGIIKNTKSVQFTNKLKTHPCSVQFTFEVPTKDHSTEVTKSLSKQNTCFGNKEEFIEEICTTGCEFPSQRMTIAVNTDPLSFLGLLRISTDTFKRMLSYMPNIDYYSYLSLLQFPQSTRSIEPHYVCNICGADFNKPSKLSDHIRGHNLGETKDCCVCRHALDTARKTPGLFRCRYCGQPFVRAYCCELHQATCARRLGRHHDVTSSLMMLR